MNNRWVIVTGASGGIGRNLCELLADMGYGIIMACRNMEKATPIYEDIRYITSNKNMRLMKLDLSSFKSIVSFATEIKEKGYDIYALVNNAGVLAHSYSQTEDGYETDLGVNYMGTYLLTRLLVPYMKANSQESFVVNTVSVTSKIGHIDEKLFQRKGFRRFSSYGTSKLAVKMFTISLYEQLKDSNVNVNAFDPGVVNTDMINMHPVVDAFSSVLLRPFLKSPMRAAKEELNALFPKKKAHSGYIYKGQNRHSFADSRNVKRKLALKLWKDTENVLKDKHNITLEEI